MFYQHFFLVSLNIWGCTYMHTPLYKCIHTPENKGQHFCSAFALSLFRMEDNMAPFFRNTPPEFTHSQHSALRQQIILNKLFSGLSSLWLTQSFRKKNKIKNYGTYKRLNLRTIATCNVLKCVAVTWEPLEFYCYSTLFTMCMWLSAWDQGFRPISIHPSSVCVHYYPCTKVFNRNI